MQHVHAAQAWHTRGTSRRQHVRQRLPLTRELGSKRGCDRVFCSVDSTQHMSGRPMNMCTALRTGAMYAGLHSPCSAPWPSSKGSSPRLMQACLMYARPHAMQGLMPCKAS